MSPLTDRLGRWMTAAAVPSFILQLLISTLGAILIGVVVSLLPSILLAAITENKSGGSFADHVASQPFFILLNEPYFIAPVLAGFFLGWLAARFFRSASTVLMWVIPAGILLVSMASGPTMNVWNTYFSKDCGASECAYEWLATQPFYTSLAYTAGWFCKNIQRRETT